MLTEIVDFGWGRLNQLILTINNSNDDNFLPTYCVPCSPLWVSYVSNLCASIHWLMTTNSHVYIKTQNHDAKKNSRVFQEFPSLLPDIFSCPCVSSVNVTYNGIPCSAILNSFHLGPVSKPTNWHHSYTPLRVSRREGEHWLWLCTQLLSFSTFGIMSAAQSAAGISRG
jgi:hypothetical protein